MLECQQIFETINLGLVVLDRQQKVTAWNHWMELHSGIPATTIIGHPIYEFYPSLSEGSFQRIVKSVLAFGNYATYSQKLHKYLFQMKNPHGSSFSYPLCSKTVPLVRYAMKSRKSAECTSLFRM